MSSTTIPAAGEAPAFYELELPLIAQRPAMARSTRLAESNLYI